MRDFSCFAHSVSGLPPEQWEPLVVHLEYVAREAQCFAARFGAAAWGRQLGLWHDLGKFSPHFQCYLLKQNGYDVHLEERPEIAARVDHSTAGAKHAVATFNANPLGWLLAYAIAGHHAGLPDGISDHASSLKQRLAKPNITWEGAPAQLLDPQRLPMPLSLDPKHAGFQLAFFGRMLFSCLVDADFLATESFLNPSRNSMRNSVSPLLPTLLDTLNTKLSELARKPATPIVHGCRQEILAACRHAATRRPGLFALTVPTGGGKTLASLAFALEHARCHGSFERVIYAIPFTSIIEQTASVFRSIFHPLGDDVVLEHHSNFDPDEKRTTFRSRLAAENWDAPLVVTTNVQLFESLFAARPSKCRKLHRLVNSILILDEVQTLPMELLQPCLAVLRELATNYRCSIVLCTATQPAFDYRPEFRIGLKEVEPIIPMDQTEDLYQRMRRTEVVQLGKVADNELLKCFGQHEQFLCIVNTRRHAAQMYELLRSQQPRLEGAFHLSTWMCGAHRSQVIEEMKERLQEGKTCRVVSTSLIEAGVDIDFPVVFRALAGLDAIAQAAGRCNREGHAALRTVYVFEPAEESASHFVRNTIGSTRELLSDFDDLLSLPAIHRYFELHFWKHKEHWDAKKIMDCFVDTSCRAFDYRAAAERFRMIEENERPIIIPWGETGRKLVEQLTSVPADEVGRVARKLQRFTVGVTDSVFEKLLGGDVTLVREANYGDRFAVLGDMGIYDRERGLRIE